MQKVICHQGKCKEITDINKAITMGCKDDLCIDIEQDLYDDTQQ